MELVSTTPDFLEELERELISFIYQESWNQTWRGENVPRHLFKSFTANARRISDSFTADRRKIDLNYLRTKEGRSAYLLYFHLASMTRMSAVLEECHRRGLWTTRPIRVLDLGSASGPALWAVRMAHRAFGGKLSEAVALDGEKAILPVAKKLWDRFSRGLGVNPIPLRTVRADFRDPRTRGTLKRLGQFDLILGSNMLNELSLTIGGKRIPLFQRILSENLAEDGTLILLEPALQKTSRELTAFRDELLTKADLHIPIPCGHSAPCPLNDEPRDWCNFEVDWEPPPMRHKIEKALEHQSGTLRFSYLVIKKGKKEPTPNLYRVISDPLETKGKNLLLLCSSDGKRTLKYKRKEDRFADVLQTARRGDLLELSMKGAEIQSARLDKGDEESSG